MFTTEKRFESDIEEFFLSPAGGYTHNQDAYDSQLGVYKDTLLRFIQKTQPKEWKRFLLQNKVDPRSKFCLAFNNACDMDGLISVLRHGFKHRGIPFKVCYLNRNQVRIRRRCLYTKRMRLPVTTMVLFQ